MSQTLSDELTNAGAEKFNGYYFNRGTGETVYASHNICVACKLKYPKTQYVCIVCKKRLRLNPKVKKAKFYYDIEPARL